MAIKLGTKEQWFMFIISVVLVLALANYFININSSVTQKTLVLRDLPTNIWIPIIEMVMIYLVVIVGFRLVTGGFGDIFTKRSFISFSILVIVGALAYIYILEPYTSTGHLPVLKLAAAQVQTTVQSMIAP
jgi:hypothetical protein